VRIGHGIDVHAFSADATRPLWLGLVRIDDHPGLEGHSDADVVTHAVCDALLGAANRGDLGQHFPDSDPTTSGVSSRELLSACVALVGESGYRIESVDVTIVAQAPKVAHVLGRMSSELSGVVGTTVSLKATTTEGLGAIGRVEGIAASAVALVSETASETS